MRFARLRKWISSIDLRHVFRPWSVIRGLEGAIRFRDSLGESITRQLTEARKELEYFQDRAAGNHQLLLRADADIADLKKRLQIAQERSGSTIFSRATLDALLARIVVRWSQRPGMLAEYGVLVDPQFDGPIQFTDRGQAYFPASEDQK